MPRPLPIACTLSPADAAQRAGEWRRLAAAALVERERSPGRALLRFRDGDEVELTEDAMELLANLGYDPSYGARPLKRVIQKRLVDRLALALLEGEFAPGDVVEVDASGGDLVMRKRSPVAAAA